jgi:hypothetical protein
VSHRPLPLVRQNARLFSEERGMRVGSILLVFAVACAVEEAPRRYSYPQSVQQITTTPVAVDQAATAVSRDGTFAIHFDAGSFEEPVSVQILQTSSSPAPAVTLSQTYAVTVTPVTALLLQPVEITFNMLQSAVDAAGGETNLRVGHGETLGQLWFEALAGSYDPVLGRFSTTTASFSYFLVFDAAAYDACACDTGPGCQAGCGFCDLDCSAPECTIDTDCESECCLDGTCLPASYCEEPVTCYEDADCESLCCLSNVCMPTSSCEEPVECYQHGDCTSSCCVEGTCEPASYCTDTCTYDYECGTGCCYESVCAPADYCVDTCTYDYECDTGCCYESVCAPANYCVDTCTYDYECDTECCSEGVCAPADYCVQTCTYDYNCESGCCVDGICVDASYCATECTTGALGCSGDWLIECVDGQWSYEGANVRDCGSEGLSCEPVTDTWAECVVVGCDSTEWQCNDGGCIPAEYRCDRYSEGPDCADGSDEDPYCPTCWTDQDCPTGGYWQCDTGTGTCFQGA